MPSWKFKSVPFSRFGTLVWNNIAPALRDKRKAVYRKTIRNSMFNLLSAEDDHVEINKIADFLNVFLLHFYDCFCVCKTGVMEGVAIS